MNPHREKSMTITVAVVSTAIFSWLLLAGSASGVAAAPDRQSATPTPAATLFPLESLPEITRTDSNISADIAARMDQIQQQVIQLRGLIPTTRLPRVLLSVEAHTLSVQSGEFGYTTDDQNSGESTYLDALDIVDPAVSLQQIYQQMYTENIAGYYNDITKEMYVVDRNGFGMSDQLTYAHEYTHALQDQNFDFRNKLGYTDFNCTQLPDRCAAVQALVEGDATLTEQMWLENYSTNPDALNYTAAYNTSDPISGDYFTDDLYFPYRYGLNFVTDLFSRGGWNAVNAAYTQLPHTTEQIMHPEKYPTEDAVQVELPPMLFKAIPSGYTGKGQLTMGEWDLFLALVSVDTGNGTIQPDSALSAVAGWGGDRYQVYRNAANTQTIFVQQLAWDTQTEADEFFRFIQGYGAVRWPVSEETGRIDYAAWHSDDEFAAIWQNGAQIFWLVAPDSQIRADILVSAGMEQ